MTLPDGYRERAIANMEECVSEVDYISISGAIYGAFIWSGSPEGHDFWSEVKKGNLPPLPQ